MLKPFTTYAIDIFSSVTKGLSAQIMCYDPGFVGRMDFYAAQHPLPTSYLWHPTGTGDDRLIYLVLAMPMASFHVITEILRSEEPLGLELYPVTPPSGSTTDGYGGLLRTLTHEPAGEGEVFHFRAARPSEKSLKVKRPPKRAAKHQ
jgi:hypothetical protein